MGKLEGVLQFVRKFLPIVRPIVAQNPNNGHFGKYEEEIHDALIGEKGVLSDSAALGVLIASGLEMGQAIYRRPGRQVTMDTWINAIMEGAVEDHSLSGAAYAQAGRVAALLCRSSLSINRFAVDGVPGSDKTMLARALAELLGMRWKCLEHMNIDNPMEFKTDNIIYEHHRLLRTQDIDKFGAIVYIDEPVELSKEKVLKWKRGGYLVDTMDYERLKQIGKKAFELADGDEYQIEGSYIRVKIRPPGGYRVMNRLVEEMRNKNIDATSISKEQLLFLSIENRAGKGFISYINGSTYNKEVLFGVASALYHLDQRISK